MIGRLRGSILHKQPPELIIDVAGVGYEISAPMSTFYQLPNDQKEITLYTHLVVREDAQLLYGFYSERERSLFRSLIKINGIGPKLALAILSGIEPDLFMQCVQNNDSSTLMNIPGIGKKTAERLIIETRDLFKKWETQMTVHSTEMQRGNIQQNMQDAIDALTTLGYKPHDAKRAISQIYQVDKTSEELIRLALKRIVTTVGG